MIEKEFNEFEEKIIDIDEIEGTDIKINPDFYIHNALVKAQAAMCKDNIRDGFAQYRLFIEHIEVLCRAANMLPEKYEDDIKDFMKSKDYTDDKLSSLTKSTKLANKKIELMMSAVFKSKTATFPTKA